MSNEFNVATTVTVHAGIPILLHPYPYRFYCIIIIASVSITSISTTITGRVDQGDNWTTYLSNIRFFILFAATLPLPQQIQTLWSCIT